MKGRKRLYLLALAALLGIVAGCGTKGGEMGSMESQDMEAVEEAQNETSQENAAQDGESAEAFVEAPAQNERLTKEGDGYGISIRIYHSDDMAENICFNTTMTRGVTPEILVMNLAAYGMLPDAVTVQDFSIETEVEKETTETRLQLDLSADFADYLSSMGTSGEMMVMGSLVNTFLDAYDASMMKVTAGGELLETGHQIYDSWLELYDYVQASYSVADGLLQEGTVTFSYPQIQDCADTGLQEKWNNIMEKKAEDLAESLEEGDTLQGSFDVKTMNDELLSILVSGEISAASAAYPTRFQYTYNIDMRTGENIRLATYRNVDQIAEDMMNGTGYTVSGDLAEEFQKRLTVLYGDTEQLAAALRSFDFGKGQVEYPVGYSYQENGKTCLCMEVPHALGDFVTVELE